MAPGSYLTMYPSGSCCAAAEIAGIYTWESPEATMKAIHEKLWLRFRYPVVLFSGTVDSIGDNDYRGLLKEPNTYVQALVEFIKKEGFGAVVEGPDVKNYRNHPNHTVRVCVWTPKWEAIHEWYNRQPGGPVI